MSQPIPIIFRAMKLLIRLRTRTYRHNLKTKMRQYFLAASWKQESIASDHYCFLQQSQCENAFSLV